MHERMGKGRMMLVSHGSGHEIPKRHAEHRGGIPLEELGGAGIGISEPPVRIEGHERIGNALHDIHQRRGGV